MLRGSRMIQAVPAIKASDKQRVKNKNSWWMRINIMGWSRPMVMKAMPKDKMALSEYLQSKYYCSYLNTLGRNSVGFGGQVSQMVKNLMYFLVLVEMVKGNKIHSKRMVLQLIIIVSLNMLTDVISFMI